MLSLAIGTDARASTGNLVLKMSVNTKAPGTILTMSCVTSTHCVAVGRNQSNEIMVWSGNPSHWSTAIARMLILGSSIGNAANMTSISCPSTSMCVAVGNDSNNNPIFIEGNPALWTGSMMRRVAVDEGLFSVSCPSASFCVAVGKNGQNIGVEATGDPATWSAANFKLLKSAQVQFGLFSVSCSATSFCTGVGESHGLPAVISGNPVTWSDSQIRTYDLGTSFSGVGSNQFNSVSCPTKTFCVAVGQTAKWKPVTMVGNPSTWGTANIKVYAAAPSNAALLYSVACRSASICFANGADTQGFTANNIVLSGNPANWNSGSPQKLVLAGVPGNKSQIGSDSCNPSSCYVSASVPTGQTELAGL